MVLLFAAFATIEITRCYRVEAVNFALFRKSGKSAKTKLSESKLQIRFNQKPCTVSTVFYCLIFLRKLNLGRIMERCGPPKIGIPIGVNN